MENPIEKRYIPWEIRISEIFCYVLIIYFLWYVEAYGNNAKIIYTAFLGMMGFLFIFLCRYGLRLDYMPYGIKRNFTMVLYCVVTGLIVAYSRSELFYYCRQYLIYAFIAFAIAYISRVKGSFGWILNAIKIAVLICCIHLMTNGYHYDSQRIVLSSNSNPNILGIILSLGIFAIAYSTKCTIGRIVVKFIFIMIVYYNVIMTGSRKSLIVSSVIIVFWLLCNSRRIAKEGSIFQKIFFIGVLLAMVFFIVYMYKNFFVDTEVFDRLSTMTDEESNSNRVEYYINAIEIFKENPLFGGGLHQFGYWSGTGVYSHSTYAEAISDFGLIGCILYFAPIFKSIKNLVKDFAAGAYTYEKSMIFILCCVELFLGVGTIFFYDMYHFIAWTIIYIFVDKKDVRLYGVKGKYDVRNQR